MALFMHTIVEEVRDAAGERASARRGSIMSRLNFLPSLVARVILFVVFAPSGLGKLRHLTKVTSFFRELHIPYPHATAALVGTSELVCGVLLVLGLFARLATLPLIVIMGVAILTVRWPNVHGVGDFFGLEEVLYLALLLFILVAGAGAFSVDALITRGRAPKGARASGTST
jgi:putative oxidoreductase